jgi:ribonuclease HI
MTIVYCDGGARGNPGPAAAAFVVVQKGRIIHRRSRYLGRTTNNVAEYSAVVMAISWLINNSRRLKDDKISFILDSELVAKQLSGQYKVKNEKLKKLATRIKQLESKINGTLQYRAVARSKNKLADFLVNSELDKKNRPFT